jgi:hypothetical protein
MLITTVVYDKEPLPCDTGQVIEGQSTLNALYKGYGDIPPFGNGPDQQEIHRQGNGYVRSLFPQTDFIHSCHLVDPAAPAAEDAAAGDSSRAAEREAATRQEEAAAKQDAEGGEEEQEEEEEEQGRDTDNDAVLDGSIEEGVVSERLDVSDLECSCS